MDVPHIVAGRFRIECEIGKGGMGTVYRATQLGLERPVAVKIIKQEFASDQQVAERFMREARTMAKLRHAHAAMIFDAGNLPDGRHFIVMEFVEGITLADELDRVGRFEPERAVRIASDICDVLSEAHRLGIVHRDLKPSNIMLNERGVCVLDFGVAKVLATSTDVTATHATTASGVIVGTPRYMSPEQCLGQRVGARSDLYSLGVLLYEMLAGQPPFTDPLASAVLVKQATSAPPPLPKLRADVPRPLAVAVHSLLAKHPDDRPDSAAAARSMLERSIAKPRRETPETEPFAGTMATIGASRGVFFRAATPIVLIAVLGALLFAWGGTDNSVAPQAMSSSMSAAAAPSPAVASVSSVPLAPAPIPAVESSQPVVNTVPQDAQANARLIRNGNHESVLATIREDERSGASQLLVMKKKGNRYYVDGKAPLDKSDFRGARWSIERVDIDGDGYDEVLCTGVNARQPAKASRLVLYIPRSRKIYSMRLEPYTRGDRMRQRVTLSSSAMTADAAPFRNALLARVRSVSESF